MQNHSWAEPIFHQFTSDLIVRSGFLPNTVRLDIGAADEMYAASVKSYPGNVGLALFKYIESGLRMFDVYRQAVARLGGFHRLGPVLDFGSGWGRLTRFLAHYHHLDRIWASDLYHDAVAWQAETFGVNGLVSVSDPDRFAFSQQHSIVFAGSVFTHLPPDLFQRWMRKLYRLVAPDGVMMFSVSDETWLRPGDALSADGITFFRRSESASLDLGIYGDTFVNQDYLASTIASCDPSRKLSWRSFPKALYENQRLCIVAGRDINIDDFELKIAPIGGSTYFRSDGRVGIGGWGIDLNPRQKIVAARVFVGDLAVAEMVPVLEYDEASKYFPAAPNPAVQWSFDLEPQPPGTVLRIEMISSTGSKAYCYFAMPSLPAYVPRT
jgi:hypothetical protein